MITAESIKWGILSWIIRVLLPGTRRRFFCFNTRHTQVGLSSANAVSHSQLTTYLPVCQQNPPPIFSTQNLPAYEPVEITNKMQPCNRIYQSKIYWRLNMFRAAHPSSSGAPNCICSLWFIYTCGNRQLSRLGGNWPVSTQPGQRQVTTCVYKPEAANIVWSSWWWAVCRSKHVEPSINFEMTNSITRLHFVSYFYWFILWCTDQ
jgi:hypothetical protein